MPTLEDILTIGGAPQPLAFNVLTAYDIDLLADDPTPYSVEFRVWENIRETDTRSKALNVAIAKMMMAAGVWQRQVRCAAYAANGLLLTTAAWPHAVFAAKVEVIENGVTESRWNPYEPMVSNLAARIDADVQRIYTLAERAAHGPHADSNAAMVADIEERATRIVERGETVWHASAGFIGTLADAYSRETAAGHAQR